MVNILEKLYGDEIDKELGKGRGTGLISKFLSLFSFLLLTGLVVVLIKNKEYIPLLLLLTLFINYINFLILLVGVAYFAYIGQWIEMLLVASYLCCTFVSIIIGRNHVKKLIFANKPIIDPLEGMYDIGFLLILQCVLLGLALLFSNTFAIILWVLFGFVTIYLVARLLSRAGDNWRKIHYSLMMRYARCAGLEAGKSETHGEEWNINSAIGSLLKTVYLKKTQEEINQAIERIWERRMALVDLEPIKQLLFRRNPNIEESRLDKIMEELAKLISDKNDNGIMVRYTIAEVVEDIYGPEERTKYLLEVFSGKAR